MDENNEQSLAVPARRPGWEFTIPGELLQIGSKRWTDEQKANGIKIRCVYPTPADEKRAVNDAVNEGGGGHVVTYIQARNAMSEIDGTVIPYIERELVWNDLGPNGRQLVVEFWNMALTPDEGAVKKARASFRVSL